jgi:hypothetical protein
MKGAINPTITKELLKNPKYDEKLPKIRWSHLAFLVASSLPIALSENKINQELFNDQYNQNLSISNENKSSLMDIYGNKSNDFLFNRSKYIETTAQYMSTPISLNNTKNSSNYYFEDEYKNNTSKESSQNYDLYIMLGVCLGLPFLGVSLALCKAYISSRREMIIESQNPSSSDPNQSVSAEIVEGSPPSVIEISSSVRVRNFEI